MIFFVVVVDFLTFFQEKIKAGCETSVPLSIDIPLRQDSETEHRGFARVGFADHDSARAALRLLEMKRIGRPSFSMDNQTLTSSSAVEKTDKTLHAIRQRLHRTLELNAYYASLLEQHGYTIASDGRAVLRTAGDIADKTVNNSNADNATIGAAAAPGLTELDIQREIVAVFQ